jgi:transposase
MVFVLRTGTPWRDLPALFGKWSMVYSRWSRWTASGVWARVLRAFGSFARGTTRFADSTRIKLHQHAANPAGGQSSQAMGRTKGGLNTKLTTLVDSHGRPVSLGLHCGQHSDIHTIQSHICLLRGRPWSQTRASTPTVCGPASLQQQVSAPSLAAAVATALAHSAPDSIAADTASKTSSPLSNATVVSPPAMKNSPPHSSPLFNSPLSSSGSAIEFANPSKPKS